MDNTNPLLHQHLRTMASRIDQFDPIEDEADVTYVLSQISTREDGLNVQNTIVDPAFPSSGTDKDFTKLPDRQKVALIVLRAIKNTLNEIKSS